MNKSIKTKNSYHRFSDFLLDRHGERVYRIPIDIDLGCPNRNSDGSGGCTFCPVSGNRAQQTLEADGIEEQVSKAIEFARSRYKAKKFIAYIQAFTGTFAPTSVQKKIYSKILKQHDFESLYIGTRPDCLPAPTLDYLEELSQKIDVWIELGVQTSHDKTLLAINREHDWECSVSAINKLSRSARYIKGTTPCLILSTPSICLCNEAIVDC